MGALARMPFLALALAVACANGDGDDTSAPAPPARAESRPCPPASPGAEASADQALVAHTAVFEDPLDPDKQAAWRSLLPRYGEHYVVEGDLLLLEPELEEYLVEVASTRTSLRSGEREATSELFLNLSDDGPPCWLPDERELTYSVDRATFCPDCDDCACASYRDLLTDLDQAAREWEQACPSCGVRFAHRVEFDAAPDNDAVLFVVRQCEMFPKLGLAFFPRDGADRQYLDVAPEASTSSFGMVGVLRHELGHVLGYRHEQLDHDSGCFRQERGRWVALTEYDPASVMHYPCGQAEGQNAELEISPLDRAGHETAYTKRCVP